MEQNVMMGFWNAGLLLFQSRGYRVVSTLAMTPRLWYQPGSARALADRRPLYPPMLFCFSPLAQMEGWRLAAATYA